MTRWASLALGVCWVTILVVLDLAVVLRADNLRHHVDRLLVEEFRSAISYGAFSGGWPGDIVLEDLHIMDPDSAEKQLASFGQVRISVDWLAVLRGESPVRSIKLIDPSLSLEWNEHGRLELPSPLVEGTSPVSGLPKITVEGLRLRVVNSPYLIKPDTHLALDDFSVTLIPDGSEDWLYQFRAAIDDTRLGRLEAWGRFAGGSVELQLSRKGLGVTDGLREIMSDDVAQLLGDIGVDGNLEILGDLSSAEDGDGAVFTSQMNLSDVTVSLAGCSQQLTGLRGTIDYRDGRFTAERITGFLEGGRLWFEGEADLGGASPEVRIGGGLVGINISDDFVSRLQELPDPGPEVHRQLQRWRVRGPADVDFTLTQRTPLDPRETPRLRPQVQIHLRGADLVYTDFPYRLRDLRGTIDLNDEEMIFPRLFATRGPLTLETHGRVHYASEGDEAFEVHIACRGLSLGEDLLEALDKDISQTVRDLQAEGNVNLQLLVRKLRGQRGPVRPDVIVDLDGVRIHPRGFPFAVDDLRGRVVIDGQQRVNLEAIVGRHGDTQLAASGWVGFGIAQGESDVRIGATGLRPDEELCRAFDELLPGVATALRELRPQGAIRRCDVTLRQESASQEPVVTASLILKDLTIEPISPPVRITDVNAQVEIVTRGARREVIILEDARASIAGEPFGIKGRFLLGEGYDLQLLASGFTIDDELLTALEPLFPVLKDPTLRPEVEGEGVSADVHLFDSGRGTQVSAEIKTRGMTLKPAPWQDTRLDNVQFTLLVSNEGVQMRKLLAEIPRPAHLPLRPRLDRDPGTAPFRARSAIRVELDSCEFSIADGQVELKTSGLRLWDVPMEPWVLGILGFSDKQKTEMRDAHLAGTMNLSIGLALFGRDRVILNRGNVRLHGVHVGAGGDIYLEQGELRNIDFVMKPTGQVELGGREAEFTGSNFRVFRVPIPRIEARIRGDEHTFALTEIGGVLFGFENDPFVLRTATVGQLRRRAEQRGYLTSQQAGLVSEEQLRELISSREEFDADSATLDDLRAYAEIQGYASARRSKRMGFAELRELVKDNQRLGGRPLGVITGEATNLIVNWGTGRFWLDAHLDGVQLGHAVKTLGGNAGNVRGTLRTWLRLQGKLGELDSWAGDGTVMAEATNVVQLPFFFNVLRSLDITSWINASPNTKIQVDFGIARKEILLNEGKLTSADLDLILVPPGTISFGGIVNASLDVRHKGGIPLVSDLLDLIPSLLLSGVRVQGPVEDPTVSARSLGIGSDEGGGTAGGRKPRTRGPKK